jgi:hypothetical protein
MSSAEAQSAAKLARELQALVDGTIKPPSETAPSAAEPVIYIALVRNTRGYLEKLAHQINGTYANAWYDACAVMIRRLIETLIIESYEAHQIQDRIKDASGDYLFLRDLVGLTLAEKTWTLGRNAKKALPKIKDLGDKAAHNRRYNVHREDIDRVLEDLRTLVQELLSLAGLK